MRRRIKTERKPLTEIEILRILLSLMCVVVFLLLMLFSSCTQTEVDEDGIPPHILREVEMGFNLNVLANRTPITRSMTFTSDGTQENDTLAVAVKDTIKTRAVNSLSDEEESRIGNIWVGQYDISNGNCLFHEFFPTVADSTLILKLKQSQDESETRVYFVSNAGDLGEQPTEEGLNEYVMAYLSTETGLPANRLCMMTGLWRGVVRKGGLDDIVVNMARIDAKITFTYSIRGNGFSFTPSSVTLNSVPAESRIKATVAQLPEASYTTYSGTISTDRATSYWYLPENMAGTADGDDAVASDKQKTGKGVENATYVELRGDARQGEVIYRNVSFRFYLGNNENNYDITRNSHYNIEVTLVGIDLSDERITVESIPPIELPGNMGAAKDSETTVKITARPGQAWEFTMPEWLSALMGNGHEIAPGTTVSYQGPASLVFKAETTNPETEARRVSIPANYVVNGENQSIMITQSGSTLTVSESIINMSATAGSGRSSFTATSDLPWLANVTNGSWISLTGTTSGSATTGNAQNISFNVAANPASSLRSGTIAVRAGDTANGPTGNITVNQPGATLTVSGAATVAATPSTANLATFSATKGLSWNLSESLTWLSLTGTTSGTSNSTGSNQNIRYDVTVNPNSTSRSGNITVRAGNAVNGTDASLTKTIQVTQSGSSFSVSTTRVDLASMQISASATVTGTKGLPWTVTRASGSSLITPDGGTSSTATGSAQTMTFNVPANTTNASRAADFTIAVPGGNHSRRITITQAAATTAYDLVIDNAVYQEFLRWTQRYPTEFPPFNFDGVTDWKGVWMADATNMGNSYKIQVQRTQKWYPYPELYSTLKAYCADLTEDGYSDWRMPSILEMVVVGMNWARLEQLPFFDPCSSRLYLSCSVPSGDMSRRGGIHYKNVNTMFTREVAIEGLYTVRCVRDKR